ncbi:MULTISPECIES: hypothetical protein [unclassified Xanthomonas]|uniref:hypothetical protein n=1 Tax=unclassified Xanthomonas TaxID=2643310 RepID=UPI002A7EABD9|nr:MULTISPECIES: hypothetical protein [unclassified Xanthomonas]MDY4297548.1 hypothetical protein [Xanthomonas sp. LF02-5]MDY4359342.1 hypothetical protein [Xanthomonas sp. LF04-12]
MSNQEATHVRLPIEAVPDLRKALTNGLYAMVEAIRIKDEMEALRGLKRPFPDEAIPILPGDGSADSLAPIAGALLWLEAIEELPKGGA